MYEIGDEEVEAVRKVLHSKKLFRYQPGNQGECDLFEREFENTFGTGHAVLLSSGTNALVAGLLALGIREGDEVLVPAYTFVATPAAVAMAGATPVVVNVDGGLGISIEDAKSKVTPKTKAILPVHMDGLAADLGSAMGFARDHGLHVLEDCAQAIGGSYRGRRLGTWGDVGAFSLNENKNISCGEGGIAITSRRDLYERLFCLHDLSAQFNPVKKELFETAQPFLGQSMRVSEILGAIMRVQLGRLDGILARLRERKRILLEALNGIPQVSPILGHDPEGDCASSLHLRFSNPAAAAEASKRLGRQGIIAAFPSLRPAHVAWKWLQLFRGLDTAAARADLLPSMDLMMSVLKYDLDPSLGADETSRIGMKIREILT